MPRWVHQLFRLRRDCTLPERDVTPGQEAAEAALDRARADRQAGRERGPEVSAEASRLRHLREHNHFAEAIGQLYRGGRV